MSEQDLGLKGELDQRLCGGGPWQDRHIGMCYFEARTICGGVVDGRDRCVVRPSVESA